MPSIEERVAYLEGRLEDHAAVAGDLRNAVNRLRDETLRLRDEMARRFEQVDQRFGALDQKVDRHFTWLVGIQVTALVAMIGILIGSYYR